MDEAPHHIPQGSARRAADRVVLRWQRSQKLLGYYDAESHALIYQDAQGKEVDRVALPPSRSIELTNDVE